jgi:hypothetical protein
MWWKSLWTRNAEAGAALEMRVEDVCTQERGRREIAQQMANHESARTTGLYDRRDDEVSLDEVERIVI